jgi:hypothetical protein
MNDRERQLQDLIDKDRPWYLNGYAEIFVLAMIPLVLILSAFLK